MALTSRLPSRYTTNAAGTANRYATLDVSRSRACVLASPMAVCTASEIVGGVMRSPPFPLGESGSLVAPGGDDQNQDAERQAEGQRVDDGGSQVHGAHLPTSRSSRTPTTTTASGPRNQQTTSAMQATASVGVTTTPPTAKELRAGPWRGAAPGPGRRHRPGARTRGRHGESCDHRGLAASTVRSAAKKISTNMPK